MAKGTSDVQKSTKICTICNLTIALAESTSANGCHMRCEALEAARKLVNIGIQLTVSDNPKELEKQLCIFVKQALGERTEEASKKLTVILKTSGVLLGNENEVKKLVLAEG